MPLSIVETALAERTLALVDLPSPSHEEGLVYDYVRGTLHHLPLAHDDGETLFYAKREQTYQVETLTLMMASEQWIRSIMPTKTISSSSSLQNSGRS